MSLTAIRSRDWTRGHGIPFDRNLCPPDDELTDLAAWLAGRFDSLAATKFRLCGSTDGKVDPVAAAAGSTNGDD